MTLADCPDDSDSSNGTTTIALSRATKSRLDSHGRMRETYDELLNRILDSVESDGDNDGL